MDKLYENIKRLRKEKRMSQERLAELAGYTDRSSIAKIEKGLVDLPQSKIVDIARALNTTPGELMGDSYFNDDSEYYDRRARTIKRLVAYMQVLSQSKINSLMKYAEFLSQEDEENE